MRFQDYAREAKRTRRPNLLKEQYLANYGMGMSGEAAEVLEIVHSAAILNTDNLQGKIKNEISDVMWYAAELCSITDIDHAALYTFAINAENVTNFPTFPMKSALHQTAIDLSINAGRVCDYLKKVVFHGHTLNNEILTHNLAYTLASALHLLRILSIPVNQVFEYNIEKLRKRYPNQFSEALSINREE